VGAILDLIHEHNYRVGPCEVLRYDRARPLIFPKGYLTRLYDLAKASSRRSPLGCLPDAFCNMQDLSHDAVTAYLATRNPLLVFAVWTSPSKWVEAGFAYFSLLKQDGPVRFGFGAYSMFGDWWGKPEITLLATLGLAYFFREYGLSAIYGERYATNDRTARFMRQFGFRDAGTLSRYFVRDGQPVANTVSECLVEDFERAAEQVLTKLVGEGGSGEGENGQGRQGVVVKP